MPYYVHDGIRRKYNQLIKNGNFESSVYYNYILTGLSNTLGVSQNNNKLTLTDFNALYTNSGLQQSFTFIPNNKYYISVKITNIGTNNYEFLIGQCYGVNGIILVNSNTTKTFRSIITPTIVTGQGYNSIAITTYITNVNASFTLENLICVNLTDIYGSEKEPTTVDQFLADYPEFNNYVDYTTESYFAPLLVKKYVIKDDNNSMNIGG